MRQSIAADNHDQILKDIETLTLEKYVDEIAGVAVEGIGRCKTEKDVWSAVEVGESQPTTFEAINTLDIDYKCFASQISHDVYPCTCWRSLFDPCRSIASRTRQYGT
jgi:hypothetical protein